jgi:DNA-binding response OmpR family regulator
MRTKIFLVDDDEDLQHILQTSLTKADFDVTVFGNGYAIIEITDEWPDIFILDIELPDINGLEICKWVKTHEASRGIPVILMSGAPYLKVLAENVQANEYVEKPFEFAELQQKINNCIMRDKSSTIVA